MTTIGPSIAGDRAIRLQLLAAVARPYRRVFVWADDPGRSLAIRGALGREAIPLQSPVRESRKLDATALQSPTREGVPSTRTQRDYRKLDANAL